MPIFDPRSPWGTRAPQTLLIQMGLNKNFGIPHLRIKETLPEIKF
jgi:hypothetical protein